MWRVSDRLIVQMAVSYWDELVKEKIFDSNWIYSFLPRELCIGGYSAKYQRL